MQSDPSDPIPSLWDDMAEFDAASTDAALNYLMARLCQLVASDNVVWLCAVRLPDIAPGDPMHGWRAPLLRYLHPPTPADLAKVQAEVKKLDTGEVDITTVRNVSFAGTWRANRVVDLVEPDWFESDYYRGYYLGLGIHDAIWAGCPVNAESEIYCGLYRGADRPPFTAEERDTLLAALRGLKWFYRQFLLAHGLSIASSPLTLVERAVLNGLLTGQSEKQIATAQGQSQHTTHDHIKAIYRKFGVGNRPALMALWLGQPAQ